TEGVDEIHRTERIQLVVVAHEDTGHVIDERVHDRQGVSEEVTGGPSKDFESIAVEDIAEPTKTPRTDTIRDIVIRTSQQAEPNTSRTFEQELRSRVSVDIHTGLQRCLSH